MKLPLKFNEPDTLNVHGKTFTIKRLRADTWCLKQAGVQRIRFGNADEIRQDVAVVMDCGALPRSKHSYA